MIDRIKEVLKTQGIGKWRIVMEDRSASELFFLKNKLDMNRTKEVVEAEVVIYNDYEKDGESYTGQTSTKVDPTMSEKELTERFIDAYRAASFVKNKPFKLQEPSVSQNEYTKLETTDTLKAIIDAVYGFNNTYDANINSSEFFINQAHHHVVTSTGTDVQWRTGSVVIEVIADCVMNEQSVELGLFKTYGFDGIDQIRSDVEELLSNTDARAVAMEMPSMKSVDVLLGEESIVEFFQSYLARANGQSVFEGLSTYELSKSIYSEEISGDSVSIEILPELTGSPFNSRYDLEGTELKPTVILQDGVLERMVSNAKYAQYLDIEATGTMRNLRVGLGGLTSERLFERPFLQILAFSDLNVDPLSGDVGGEIRLARYFDGETYKYYSGGAISTNTKRVELTMELSSEMMFNCQYAGPKCVLLKGLEITGA